MCASHSSARLDSLGICVFAGAFVMRSLAQMATTGITICAIASVNPKNVLPENCGTSNFATVNVLHKIASQITTGTQ